MVVVVGLVEEQMLFDTEMHYLILCWLQETDLPEMLRSLLASSGYSWSQNAVEEKRKKEKKKKGIIFGYRTLGFVIIRLLSTFLLNFLILLLLLCYRAT